MHRRTCSADSADKSEGDLEGIYAREERRSEKKRVMETGMRNSLLVAPMPTASTSQILGVNECFEPFSSNMYLRRVKA